MSANKFEPHLIVLPEDDANAALVNGFLLSPFVNSRQVQVLPVAGGGKRAVQAFLDEHLIKLRRYTQRRFVLVIDFDNDLTLFERASSQIPNDVKARVFVLGVFSEPERLRTSLGMGYEDIGKTLTKECIENRRKLWAHRLLAHNETELARLNDSVRQLLFS
ncbi:MAG: hypothetical protein SNJ55_12435 [Chloroherpetonaceae bacterium]